MRPGKYDTRWLAHFRSLSKIYSTKWVDKTTVLKLVVWISFSFGHLSNFPRFYCDHPISNYNLVSDNRFTLRSISSRAHRLSCAHWNKARTAHARIRTALTTGAVPALQRSPEQQSSLQVASAPASLAFSQAFSASFVLSHSALVRQPFPNDLTLRPPALNCVSSFPHLTGKERDETSGAPTVSAEFSLSCPIHTITLLIFQVGANHEEFHLECNHCSALCSIYLRQMHWTNLSVSIEAKYWISRSWRHLENPLLASPLTCQSLKDRWLLPPCTRPSLHSRRTYCIWGFALKKKDNIY